MPCVETSSWRRALVVASTVLVSGVSGWLAGCATAPATTELTLLSLNDFHGNIQAAKPTPVMARVPDASGEVKPQPAGGVAHFATALSALKAQRPNALVVAGGDLIGASPLISSLLKDEPTLAAMGELDIAASALGNHELDAGLPELLRKAAFQIVPTDIFYFFDPHRYAFLDGEWRQRSYTIAVNSGWVLLAYGAWRWVRRPQALPVLGVWWLSIVAVFAARCAISTDVAALAMPGML